MKLHLECSQTVVTIDLVTRWRKQRRLDKTDFKSAVSTSFTTGAKLALSQGLSQRGGGLANRRDRAWRRAEDRWEAGGGAIRSRTALDGFAIRCITALLSRRVRYPTKKGSGCFPVLPSTAGAIDASDWMLERETRLELATSTLARLRSTN